MGFFQKTRETVTTQDTYQKKKSSHSIFWRLCVFLSPLCTLALIFLYGFDIPFQDGWEFVPVLNAHFEHSWSTLLTELWAQHNEHRILVPRVVMLLLAIVTGWNLLYENVITYLCAWIIFAFLVKCLYQDFKGERNELSPTIICLLSLLLFSLTQWHMWLWGWMMQIEMNVLFCVIGFRAFTNVDECWNCFWIGCAAGIAAMFSFATGLAFFPLAFLMLLQNRTFKRPHGKTMGAILLLVSGVAFGIYLWDYNFPKVPQADATNTIFRIPLYVLAYLGAPLVSYDHHAAVVLGAVGMVIWTRQAWKVFYDKKTNGHIFWMIIGLYAISSGVLTALGRWASNPLSQALSSRYLAIPSLFWISIVSQRALHWGADSENPPKLLQDRLLFFVLSCLVFASSLYGVYKADEYWDAFQLGRKALLEKTDEKNLHWLYPDAEVLKERREFLDKYKLSVFRN
ncbi:MAG TPA: hypothetical protein PKY35_11905 [Candidatus Hydrogenedentes bacterium]|nr:hypothetical protein [Candidatus Hydrogenedentota bacterium]HOL77722.1 hypothetical protein [Candidatus Hydrogenedentota bacterium]